MKYVIGVLNVFLVIATIVGVLFLYTSKSNKEIFGYLYLQIQTESMDDEPTDFDITTLKVNDFIIVKKLENYNQLKIGDVITFKMNEGINEGVTVTHRIISTNSNIITTKGDANSSTEVLDTNKDIIYGKVIYNNLVVGNVLKVLKNKYFLITSIAIPCILITIKECSIIYKTIRKKGDYI